MHRRNVFTATSITKFVNRRIRVFTNALGFNKFVFGPPNANAGPKFSVSRRSQVLRKISLGLLLMIGLAVVSVSRPMSGITVSISPTGAAVVVGLDRTFTATVSGSMNTSAV